MSLTTPIFDRNTFKKNLISVINETTSSVSDNRRRVAYLATGAILHAHIFGDVSPINTVLASLRIYDKYIYRQLCNYAKHYLRDRIIIKNKDSLTFGGMLKDIDVRKNAMEDREKVALKLPDGRYCINTNAFWDWRRSSEAKTEIEKREAIIKGLKTALDKTINILTIDEVIRLVELTISTSLDKKAKLTVE